MSSESAGHADPHAGEGMVGPHGTMADHGGDHGHDDHNMAEGHGGERLGPIDVRMWGAAGLGVVLGLVVALTLLVSIGWVGG